MDGLRLHPLADERRGYLAAILDIEREAFWQGVTSVEEVAGPSVAPSGVGNEQ